MRRPIIGLWALSVVLCLVAVVLAGMLGDLPAVCTAVLSIVVPSVGAVVARHVPRNPVGWCLLGGGLIIGLGTAGTSLASVAVERNWPSDLVHLGGWLESWTWLTGLTTNVLFAAVWFPDGRLMSSRLRPLLGLAALAELVWLLSTGTAAWLTSAHDLMLDDPPLPATGFVRWSWLVGRGAQFVLYVLSIVALVSLVVRWRRARGVARLQIRWVLTALLLVVLALVVLIVFAAAASWQNTLMTFVFDLVSVATGVAVLRYRLYDIDRLVSRSVAYLLVTGVLVGTYVGLVTALTTLLPASFNSLSVAVSTLAVAGLFVPVRRRVQAVVDRRFNRARVNRQSVIDRFAEQVRRDPAHSASGASLVGAAREVVEPSHASLWLASP